MEFGHDHGISPMLESLEDSVDGRHSGDRHGFSRQRVLEAEEAVRERGREIFYGNGTSEEKEALEDTLYALHAFTTAWQHGEAA